MITFKVMSTRFPFFKFIVAAFVSAVGFSLPAAADDVALEQLFADLQTTTEEESPGIEAQIVDLWSRSGSAALDLLLKRGEDALAAGDYDAAIGHFTAAIDHDPEFAEAWNGRATAYYLSGMVGPALDDIRQVLVLNPRHFGALRGFGVILEELGQPEAALEVYQRVLALSPHAADMSEAAERLTISLEGQSL